jgi:hypothetical protein
MDAPERGAELVGMIVNEAGEPDAIARAIALIYRQTEEAKDDCREILWYVLKAAFNLSAAHSWAFEEYLAAIERGREPSEEALAHFASQQSGDEPAKPDAEVVHGSTVLLMGDNGAQLFRFDFGDAEGKDKTVELHVLDEAGATVRSIVVQAKRSSLDESL